MDDAEALGGASHEAVRAHWFAWADRKGLERSDWPAGAILLDEEAMRALVEMGERARVRVVDLRFRAGPQAAMGRGMSAPYDGVVAVRAEGLWELYGLTISDRNMETWMTYKNGIAVYE
jgi:hypothetical protein